MYTDSWYVGGVDKMVKLMLKNQIKTYMYVLNYTIEGLTIPKWMGELKWLIQLNYRDDCYKNCNG